MSILQAYCIHCTSKAGRDGFQCSGCSELPHVVPSIIEDGHGKQEFKSACPNCGAFTFAPSWDGLLLCKCGTEYVCSDPEETEADAGAIVCKPIKAQPNRASINAHRMAELHNSDRVLAYRVGDHYEPQAPRQAQHQEASA